MAALATPSLAQDAPYHGQTDAAVVSVLKRGAERERYEAAIEFVRRAPSDRLVVDALAEAVRNRSESLKIRLAAANAISRIGHAASTAADALIDIILDPTIDDGDARIAAYAWGRLGSPIPGRLTDALHASRSERIVSTVSYALMVSGAPAAAGPILEALRLVDDIYDGRFEALVTALKNLDPAAASTMAEALMLGTTIEKLGISRALAEMLQRTRTPTDQRIVDAVLTLVGESDPMYQSDAVRVLGDLRSGDPRIVTTLLHVLRADLNGYARDAAATALVRVAPTDPRTSLAIVEAMLQAADGHVDAMAVALHDDGASGLRALGARLAEASDAPRFRMRLVHALGMFGSSAAFAVPEAATMVAGDDAQLEAAAEALPQFGDRALEAMPALVRRLRTETDHDLRHKIEVAIAAIAPFVMQEPRTELAITDRVLLRDLRDARAVLGRSEAGVEEWDEDRRERIEAIDRAVRQLATAERATYAVSAAALLTIVLLLAATWEVSWRLRRATGVFLGRRWVLLAGECDFRLEVSGSLGALRVTVRPTDGDARSDVFSLQVANGCWPPDVAERASVQAQMQPPCIARAEVELGEFGHPWALAIGDPWSRSAGRIVGQVRLTRDRSAAGRTDVRRIAFAGLRCGRADALVPLPAAASEIEEVAAVAKRWGADTFKPADDATGADFRRAMCDADIVHAAIHASPEGLCLRDEVLDGEALSSGARCRLLILSACEAGDISLPTAFLWTALNRGLNVIAAVRPVDDAVCRVFFGAFYDALLPRRNFEGVTLARAVRSGAEACERRFSAAAARLGDAEADGDWRTTVDSFILYGDPSMSWQLRKRTDHG